MGLKRGLRISVRVQHYNSARWLANLVTSEVVEIEFYRIGKVVLDEPTVSLLYIDFQPYH